MTNWLSEQKGPSGYQGIKGPSGCQGMQRDHMTGHMTLSKS